MITAQQIEAFAVQIAEPDFVISKASIEQLIGHLGDAEFKAVMARAAEISRERGRAAFAVADTLETLTGLAHAAGCPSGTPRRAVASRARLDRGGRRRLSVPNRQAGGGQVKQSNPWLSRLEATNMRDFKRASEKQQWEPIFICGAFGSHSWKSWNCHRRLRHRHLKARPTLRPS
jgi:hypothetical protein